MFGSLLKNRGEGKMQLLPQPSLDGGQAPGTLFQPGKAEIHRGGAWWEGNQGKAEFTNLMGFDSLKNGWKFTGEDYQTAYVPAKAGPLPKRLDAESSHRDLRERLGGPVKTGP